MRAKDGGPAFPLHADSYEPEFGMSLRAYIATAVCAAIAADVGFEYSTCEENAKLAVKQADALIAALKE